LAARLEGDALVPGNLTRKKGHTREDTRYAIRGAGQGVELCSRELSRNLPRVLQKRSLPRSNLGREPEGEEDPQGETTPACFCTGGGGAEEERDVAAVN